MIAIQEKAGKKRIKTKSKKSERGQLRGGWWQKNGNNLRYLGPQDHRTFTDPEKIFVKKINVCVTHNLGAQRNNDYCYGGFSDFSNGSFEALFQNKEADLSE